MVLVKRCEESRIDGHGKAQSALQRPLLHLGKKKGADLAVQSMTFPVEALNNGRFLDCR